VNRKDQRQLETVRRGQVDTAKHVAKSQEAIEESMSALQRSDKVEVARKPEADKRRPKRSGATR
jgi:hypothetical protein